MTDQDTGIPPWPDLIAEFGQVKERASQVSDLVNFTYPGLAATEEQLVAAEQRLGHPLDPMHREFLSYANGWEEFYYATFLLSTEDLGQGDQWQEITKILDAYYSGINKDAPVPVPARDSFYPFAYDPEDGQVFGVMKEGPLHDGGRSVRWLTRPSSEPYDNFFEFYSFVYQVHVEEIEEESS